MTSKLLGQGLMMGLLLSGCSTLTTSHTNSVSMTTSNELSSVSSQTSSSTSASSNSTDHTIPADLATFATDRTVDPLITYVPNDYLVRPFANEFTYPIDAQVQPTPAYLEFWHQDTTLTMNIFAQPQIFQWVQQFGVYEQTFADLYFPVTVEMTMNEKQFVYYEVGMRMKGNTSRSEFVDDNGTINGSLSFKLSFNETWDDPIYAPFNLQKTWTDEDPEWITRDKRTIMGDSDGLYGMRKLDIKWNKSRDDSLVIQPFIFGFFQKHGFMSQNSTLTRLEINGTRMGVVTINEPVDKHLIRRYLPKVAASGDLYKVGWGQVAPGGAWVKGSLRYEDLLWNGDRLINDAIIGEEDKSRWYTPAYDAKEFDATLPSPYEKLINLMRVLKENEGKTPIEYVPILESVVDIDSFINYIALSYLMGNIDDVRNWGNNYYIYFNPSEGNKAYFLPYDFDWGLGLTWNSGETKMHGTDPFEARYLMDTNLLQENRLFWYTILSPVGLDAAPYPTIHMNPDYRTSYITNLKTLNSDPYYSLSNYDALFQRYKATYNLVSGSDLGDISSFNSTEFMKNFITSTKNEIVKLP